jgi:hypothetical protein
MQLHGGVCFVLGHVFTLTKAGAGYLSQMPGGNILKRDEYLLSKQEHFCALTVSASQNNEYKRVLRGGSAF